MPAWQHSVCSQPVSPCQSASREREQASHHADLQSSRPSIGSLRSQLLYHYSYVCCIRPARRPRPHLGADCRLLRAPLACQVVPGSTPAPASAQRRRQRAIAGPALSSAAARPFPRSPTRASPRQKRDHGARGRGAINTFRPILLVQVQPDTRHRRADQRGNLTPQLPPTHLSSDLLLSPRRRGCASESPGALFSLRPSRLERPR